MDEKTLRAMDERQWVIAMWIVQSSTRMIKKAEGKVHDAACFNTYLSSIDEDYFTLDDNAIRSYAGAIVDHKIPADCRYG